MSWKLWLDDQLDDPETPNRHTPKGYIGAKTSQEALDLCGEMGLPLHMDLDHDLGGEDTAKVFLKGLSYDWRFCEGPIPTYEIHSQNPVGREWIHSFLRSWAKSLE